ncbi:MAG: fasciclin domain-containing protein [Candidatus Nanopelagicaceae bacterium]|jgi:uncharacterized surface protein with fasciclin (FAS1) repeats|nr:fasciclin domain-containing protein [Candidatus Nanopelagicaceae bacterium]
MKKLKRTASAALALGLMFSPISANAADDALKSMPLTEVLNLQGAAFDRNSADFDIFTWVFMDVWGQLPNSPVEAISKGDTALTAFVPTDAAFRNLVKYLTGKTLKSERAVANAVMSLGAETVEKVILYHVIVGDPILSPDALKANGAKLNAASGETVGVKVSGTTITLIDKVKKHKNPVVILSAVDINKGNKQVAHAINQVLLPTLK